MATELIYATNFGDKLNLTVIDKDYLGATMVLNGRDFTQMVSSVGSTIVITAVCEFFDWSQN